MPGKEERLGHRYRLVEPLPEVEETDDFVVPGDNDAPRTPLHRYRIYKVVYDRPQLLATATTREDVGVALVTLGEEGQFSGGCFGLLDTHGREDVPGTWIVQPWDITP